MRIFSPPLLSYYSALVFALALGLATPSRLAAEGGDVVNMPGFSEWVSGFRNQALARGISPSVFDRLFASAGYNKRVVYYDRNQAEFKKGFSEYIDLTTTPSRLALGKEAARAHGALLDALEKRFGVDAPIILGVWGVETRFGHKLGDIPLAQSLGTLAFDGRRRKFAQDQLIAALRLAQKGELPPEAMIGSWAGALGHTQFIPTSYRAYAVDGDGDGRRNLYNIADALASTANYLKRSGWRRGQPWGVEVIAPANIRVPKDPARWRSMNEWRRMGVRRADGGPLVDHGNAALIAPGGASGPKFLVFNNFRVIKRYNNSTLYAVAVGHLGDLVAGKPGLSVSLSRPPSGLFASEIEEVQRKLLSFGFDAGDVDGIMGPKTREALAGWQARSGVGPSASPEDAMRELLRRG